MKAISTILLILIFLLFGAMFYRACEQDPRIRTRDKTLNLNTIKPNVKIDSVYNVRMEPLPYKHRRCTVLNSSNCTIIMNVTNVKLINCENVTIKGNMRGLTTDPLVIENDTNNTYIYDNAWINTKTKKYVEIKEDWIENIYCINIDTKPIQQKIELPSYYDRGRDRMPFKILEFKEYKKKLDGKFKIKLDSIGTGNINPYSSEKLIIDS